MGKKNPFVFTIGFDKSDPDHVYVTELLNTTEKKAKLIVAAILAYTGRTDETGNGSISMEPDMLRPMMQQIIREEVIDLKALLLELRNLMVDQAADGCVYIAGSHRAHQIKADIDHLDIGCIRAYRFHHTFYKSFT